METGLQKELVSQLTSVSSKAGEFTHLPWPFHDSCFFRQVAGEDGFFVSQSSLW
jgi:hypothetical protein